MEMSVSFTEERENVMLERGYKAAKSELGNVYFPEEGITVKDQICVRYMDYPWLTCFEVDGIDIQK